MTSRILVMAVLVAVATVAGCSGGTEPASPATTASFVPSASPTATSGETALDAGGSDDDTHEELAPEPTSAGPLNAELMPEPEVLGPKWTFDVVDGDPHDEGFVSNDAATHQRDPADVAMLSVPFGCEQRTATELLATHVLDATYTDGSQRAVALRMRFDTAETAARFLSARHADLVACAAQKPAYDGRPTVSEVGRIDGATVSRRTEPGVPGHWAEAAVDVGGGDVVIVALPALSPGDTAALARRLEAAAI